MASSSFTPNLGLCAWKSTDRPKRIDFVNDNSIIDTKLGEHLADTTVHVTAEEKAKYDSPYTVLSYVGDGKATQTFTLDDNYAFAIIFQKYYPVAEIDSSSNVVSHFAIVGRSFGSTSNMSMTSTTITVTQDSTASDGVINNFNEAQGQYVMLLFK